MRRVWELLCVVTFAGMFLSVEAAYADDFSMTSVINKAAYQRMLSQRVVKLYCQIGLGVMPEASRVQLAETMKTYEQNLHDVGQHANDLRSQKFIEDMTLQWRPVRAMLLSTSVRGDAENLMVRSDALLKAAENLMEHLQRFSGDPSLALVKLSGRQRMLSQRMAKYYMLREWGVAAAQVDDAIKVADKEFSDALNNLLMSPENSPEVQDELGVVRSQWDLLQVALAQKKDSANHQVVADTSDSILKHMDHVTQLYVELTQR